MTAAPLAVARRLWRRARFHPTVNGVLAPPLRFVARRLRWDLEPLVVHLPRVGVAEAELPGGSTLRLHSPGNEIVANRLYWQGLRGYEPETTSVFWELARRASVIVDAGAHVGLFTILAALANPDARVLAFEPMAPILDQLRSNLALNGVKNVEAVAAALGDEEGEAEIHFAVTDQIATVSSLSLPFMEQWGLPLRRHSVSVTTVDGAVAARGLDRVDLVKIDTEMTEHAVLRGMRSTIERHHPTIVCEILPGHPHLETITTLVRDAGYSIYHLSANGPVARSEIVPHWTPGGTYETALRNYLFTRLSDSEVRRLWGRAVWGW